MASVEVVAIALKTLVLRAFYWFRAHVYGIIYAMSSSALSVLQNANPTLPDWIRTQLAALQTQIAERDASLAERDTRLAEKDAELKRRELKIQQLTLELAQHKRLRFGRTSEALSPEQRDLFADTRDEDGAAIATELEEQHVLEKVD